MLQKLKSWAIATHKIERQLVEYTPFSAWADPENKRESTYPPMFERRTLQAAHHQIVLAKTAAQNLVRLHVQGKTHRDGLDFDASENGCLFTAGTLLCDSYKLQHTQGIKAEAQELFYETLELVPYLGNTGYNIQEFIFYQERLRTALFDFTVQIDLYLTELKG